MEKIWHLPHKIVLHSLNGDHPQLDELVMAWIQQGVKYVGIVGVDASKIEDIVDELCVGDGSDPYYMLTASHEGETLQDAVNFAEQVGGDYGNVVKVVEF